MTSRLLRVPFYLMAKEPLTKRIFLTKFTMNNYLQTSSLCGLKFNNDVNKKEFFVLVDGIKAFVEYNQQGNVLKLDHTNVPESLGGRGIGKILAEKTFEYVAKNNLKMEVHCEFLKSYLEKHGQQYKKYLS